MLYVLRPLGGHGGVGRSTQYGWYPCRARALSPTIGVGGLFLGILPLFYIAFSAKFSAKKVLPLDLVGPVSGTHRSFSDVFGVTCLESMTATGVFFGFVLLLRVALDALLTKPDGLDLSA